MNSGVQCLTHCKALYDAIEKNSEENPGKGTSSLFDEFREILHKQWSSSSLIVPSSFKYIYSSRFRQFSGSDQHDCQEFLSFLLDGLLEDLNSHKHNKHSKHNKHNKPAPDPDPVQDQELSELLWEQHRQRNSSFLSDLVFGQFSSSVICDLGHLSLVFDPFLMVSLPIPRIESRSFQFIYFKENLKLPAYKSSFVGTTRSQVHDLIHFAASTFGLPQDQLKAAAALFDFNFKDFLHDLAPLDPSQVYFVYEVLSQSFIVIDQRKRKMVQSRATGPSVAYSRVLSLAGSETFEDVWRVVYNSLNKSHGGYLKEFEVVLDKQGTEEPRCFTLNYVNPLKDSQSETCRLCGKLCQNCCFPCSGLRVQESLPGSLRLEIIWSRNLADEDFKGFKSFLSHSSVEHARRALDSSRKSRVELARCIQEFQKEERLEGLNRIYCKKCQGLKEGTKQMSFSRLPQVLILHLKRFKQVQGTKVKDNQLVGFEVEGMKIVGKMEEGVYDLFAVANHYGDMNFGHYTAFCINHLDNQWYEFDDEKVSRVDPTQVVSAAAYLLFYQKR